MEPTEKMINAMLEAWPANRNVRESIRAALEALKADPVALTEFLRECGSAETADMITLAAVVYEYGTISQDGTRRLIIHNDTLPMIIPSAVEREDQIDRDRTVFTLRGAL